MRVLAVTLGLAVAALLPAMPAVAAHGGPASEDAAPASAADSMPATRVCEIDLKRLEAFLASKADTKPAPADTRQAQEQSAKPPADKPEQAEAAPSPATLCAAPSDGGKGVGTSPATPAPLG